jgi:ABC-type dipeptide/oligopeptide/nickel transport system permease component
MARYVVSRIGQGIITFMILASLVFLLARLIGNPVDLMLSESATEKEREFLTHQLGLDRPLHIQYAAYMGELVKGNAGVSFRFSAPVMVLFSQRFPNTLKLAAVAMTIALLFGSVLGVFSATRRNTLVDHFCRVLSVAGISAPSFWVGLMLIFVLAVHFRLLPVARMGGISHYVLPGLTLSFFTLAGIARLTRSSMIEALDSEYVKLARIKGVSHNAVVWRHCLRNAVLPTFTFAGQRLAYLMGGSVVVETVFSWPGVGQLIYEGIIGRDYPLVQGCVLLLGFLIVALNLVVDIVYAYIDPRIRLAGGD